MSGTFSEDAARKLCFEQDNQIRVLKQEVEYRKKRDEKLTYVAADITGKLADAEIELGALRARYREAVEALQNAVDKHYLWLHPGDEPEACAPCGLRIEVEAVLAKAREAQSTSQERMEERQAGIDQGQQ